ncbi:MAG: hypothetical protein ACLFQV_05445 [Vulcanimicrobiota bacterium]
MNISVFDSCYKSGPVNNSGKSSGAKAERQNKALGYSPPPSDSFEKEDKTFTEKVAGGVKGFVNKGFVRPAKALINCMKSNFTAQAMAAGTVIGGAGGAFIGHEAARIEAGNTQTSIQTWEVPVTESRNLGNIPDSHYQPTFGLRFWSDRNRFHYDEQGRLSGASHGIDPVHRQAPVFNDDGSVMMREVTESVSSKRFGPVGGTLMGIGLGAVGGFLGGLAISLIHKVIKEG